MPTKKAKYFYNAHTLKYEKVVVTWKQRILRWLGRSAAVITLAAGVLLFVYYTDFFDSPKEKQLKREIVKMQFEYHLQNDKLNNFEKILGGLQDRDDNIYRVIFEAEPIPGSVREAGFGGSNKYQDLEYYENSDLMISSARRLDKMSKQLYIQSKSYADINDMIKSKTEMLASIPAIQPISKKDMVRIASGFGYRIHPFYKTMKLHTGIDFTAPTGTEIYCTGNGVIVDTDYGSGYGHNVVVDHGFGFKTIYAHMHKIKVKKGQKVQRGDVLGTVGNSGLSMAPHLHYEVLKDNIKVDPINYFYNDLSPEEYEKVIELATQHNQSFD
ncbi:MAG: M23 family metallopeptidase [Chitinophagales bacterium]|nr:M23 family metallopeptidase [Chitinophagales bacterium]